jgi:hypoxanthine phosphoribosyltransferase
MCIRSAVVRRFAGTEDPHYPNKGIAKPLHHSGRHTEALKAVEFPPGFLYYPGFAGVTCRTSVENLKVLITREQIAAKVAEIGARITADFAGETVVLVGVLKGAAIFLADLAREIKLDATFDFIAVSGYGDAKEHSGEVKLVKDVDRSMAGRNVILVEDILDTGLTLTYIKKLLQAHQPKRFKIAALLDKISRRTEAIAADYVGFVIPDEFVVGYGLDFAEHYRNLPDVCVLQSDGT